MLHELITEMEWSHRGLEMQYPRFKNIYYMKSYSKSKGGIRADLVSKVHALLMWHVLPSSSGENRELLTDVQDLEQNQSDFKYEATMVRISALGWSSDLRNLPEINFIQLYDYLVVSREYRHIVLRGTHHRKYHRIPESEAKAVAL